MLGVQPSLTTGTLTQATPSRGSEAKGWGLWLSGCLLVALPVFLQAPWVRLAPFSAALFTAPLLFLGIAL